MADIDVSMYPKANPNQLLDTTSGYLGVANQALDARQKHQDLVKGQVDYLANGLGALASKADLSPEDMVGFGQRAVDEGIIDPQTFSVELAQIQAANGDQGKLRQLATQYQLRALDAGSKFSAQFGTPSTIDSGGYINPVTVSPLTGIHQLAPPIEKTNTPQDLSAQTPVQGPNGLITGTMGQALQNEGMNPLTGKPLPAPAPLAAPVPIGGPEAAKATGEASGAQLAQDRLVQSGYQASIVPLTQAIVHIDALGDNATGPGTEDLNTIQSALQTLGIKPDPEKVAHFDELKKYLTNIGRSNGNTGTNDQLAAAISGSPGTTVSTLANKDILRTLLAMARFRSAQVTSFDQQGLPENGYGKYASQFNSTQDPRAYSFDLMAPEERVKLVKGLSGAEKTKFVKSLRNAVDLGLVTAPNG